MVLVTPADDWRALLRTRTNALVSGSADALDAFVDAARAELREPILEVACEQGMTLTPARTVVLRNVNLLDPAAQAGLAAWLDDPRNKRTQIVSVTPAPLLSRVSLGEFNYALYYRLNTLYFTVQLA